MHPHYSSRPYVTPPGTITGDDWRDHAACAGETSDLFFPTSYLAAEAKPRVAAAIAVCRSCPVITDCLAYALDMERGSNVMSRDGIWGGTTPSQRFNLNRARTRKAQGAAS